MIWVALQTRLPATKAKLIVLLPTFGVKACATYQFLKEFYEQCRSLCIQKPRAAGFYILHYHFIYYCNFVIRNEQGFS